MTARQTGGQQVPHVLDERRAAGGAEGLVAASTISAATQSTMRPSCSAAPRAFGAAGGHLGVDERGAQRRTEPGAVGGLEPAA